MARLLHLTLFFTFMIALSKGQNTCPLFQGLESNTCSGLTFNLGGANIAFPDYNVISFGSFQAGSGDVQGRVAVRNAFSAGTSDAGFSVGASVGDSCSPFALIANTINLSNGAITPGGAFIGSGSSNIPSSLQSSIIGSCASINASSSCLTSIFDNAQTCYSNYQTQLASLTDSATASVVNSQLSITCSSSQNVYSFTVSDTTLQSITYYGLSNCNSNAAFIINVAGTGDVYINGDAFPANSDNVLYNILGSGRTIYIKTAVNGAILAPRNNLNQTDGVINGRVVVGDVLSVKQVNLDGCASASSSSSSSSGVSVNTPVSSRQTSSGFCFSAGSSSASASSAGSSSAGSSSAGSSSASSAGSSNPDSIGSSSGVGNNESSSFGAQVVPSFVAVFVAALFVYMH